jgi:hypothetical protein
LQPHDVTSRQFAVDRQIARREIASAPFELQPDPHRPDFFWFQRRFLANQPDFVPGSFRKADERWDRGARGLPP